MNIKKSGLVIVLLMGLAGSLFAQQPLAILEYFENNSGGLRLITLEGEEYLAEDIGFGGELPLGVTLVTEDEDYAELRLQPNGSIIRVSENTNFSIDNLQGQEGSTENAFTVAVGKFRAVVGKSDTSQYKFRGQSAVCAVRGTDLGMSVLPDIEEALFVLDGLVDYTNAAGETIEVTAGMAADAVSEVFEAAVMSQEQLADFMSGMEFESLQKSDVPGYQEVSAPPPEEPTPPPPPAPTPAEPPKEAGDGFLARLLQIMGIELGSVTIGDRTYAKTILQPRIALGKLKVAFYLPIVYTSNMLDPNDWYRPEGNNEWSFGTDQEGWQKVAEDLLEDFFLKFRYIQYGEQRDPFFFKLGNLNNITIGHGTIMRNYANDTDFPAVRRVGVNAGVDTPHFGIEAMVNHAGDPEIFGGRIYVRPAGTGFPLAIGVTLITDFQPDQAGTFGDPIFLNGGFDLDFPITETDLLSMILFADIAGMIPYLREDYSLLPGGPTSVESGFRSELLWDDGKLKNWGLATGIFGKILPLDYRLEFRYSQGSFIPAFYNNLYERKRAEYAQAVVSYLALADTVKLVKTMGIYGEAGYTLEGVFSIEAGYLWPWNLDAKEGDDRPDDFFHLEAGIMKGLFPVYASIAYDRSGLITSALNKETFVLFNENTVLKGELVYPVAPMLEIALGLVNLFVEGDSRISVSIVTRANY